MSLLGVTLLDEKLTTAQVMGYANDWSSYFSHGWSSSYLSFYSYQPIKKENIDRIRSSKLSEQQEGYSLTETTYQDE